METTLARADTRDAESPDQQRIGSAKTTATNPAGNRARRPTAANCARYRSPPRKPASTPGGYDSDSEPRDVDVVVTGVDAVTAEEEREPCPPHSKR